jgi:propane monooxygenase coupling protein
VTTESTTATFGERNATASNMCGFTLMNNQVGTIIAEVLSRLPSWEVEHLPSMIRVDGEGKFELVYADVDEEAGEDEDWFGASEFEENMSTHYGRMVHLDDRTIMFANPEDAADYIGFDLTASS